MKNVLQSAGALNRPAPSRLPRRARRLIVAAFGLAAAGLFAADYAFAGTDGIAGSLFRAAFATLSLAALFGFMASPAWFGANAPDTALDEREIAARNAAYLAAYRVLALCVCVGGVYFVTLGPDFGLWMPPSLDHWWTIVWGAICLALALPAAILAWTAPDPLPESSDLAR
jgi:hypothetical protein